MNIFFTSDTHYHHKNIVRGCSAWEGDGPQRTRNFDTLEEHDAALVQNINNTVKENDILYHLGDWSFGGIDQIWNFRRQINCKNIHLILGNHDHHIENNKVIEVPVKGQEGVFLIHLQNLFVEVRDKIRTRKIGGQIMTLDHFAQRTWEKAHHGTWCLYGHSHRTLPVYYRYADTDREQLDWELYGVPDDCKFKTMDVGVDTHPEFRPYHFDEISAIMKNRMNLRVDHHNENTN